MGGHAGRTLSMVGLLAEALSLRKRILLDRLEQAMHRSPE